MGRRPQHARIGRPGQRNMDTVMDTVMEEFVPVDGAMNDEGAGVGGGARGAAAQPHDGSDTEVEDELDAGVGAATAEREARATPVDAAEPPPPTVIDGPEVGASPRPGERRPRSPAGYDPDMRGFKLRKVFNNFPRVTLDCLDGNDGAGVFATGVVVWLGNDFVIGASPYTHDPSGSLLHIPALTYGVQREHAYLHLTDHGHVLLVPGDNIKNAITVCRDDITVDNTRGPKPVFLRDQDKVFLTGCSSGPVIIVHIRLEPVSTAVYQSIHASVYEGGSGIAHLNRAGGFMLDIHRSILLQPSNPPNGNAELVPLYEEIIELGTFQTQIKNCTDYPRRHDEHPPRPYQLADMGYPLVLELSRDPDYVTPQGHAVPHAIHCFCGGSFQMYGMLLFSASAPLAKLIDQNYVVEAIAVVGGEYNGSDTADVTIRLKGAYKHYYAVASRLAVLDFVASDEYDRNRRQVDLFTAMANLMVPFNTNFRLLVEQSRQAMLAMAPRAVDAEALLEQLE